MHGNPDDYYEESVWQAEVDAICSDMVAPISFILAECTGEEFVWLSEVFDDVMDKTRSSAFLDCLRQRVQSVENAEWKQTILEDVRTAAEYIDN